jgi:hypothetical protein
MECFHFPLCLAQVCGRIKSFSDRFTLNLSGEPEAGSVARIAGPGTVTNSFATLAGRGGDRTAAEIPQDGDLTKYFRSLLLKLGQ